VATVNELVADGLVRRTPDRVDRRRNVVTITKSGAKALERLDSTLDGVQRAVLAPLAASERKVLPLLLVKLS